MEKALSNGFIVLHRKMQEWEWYSEPNTFVVFLHLLLLANWKDGRFQGTDVKAGSLVTSYQHLADDCGLSIQNVRTAISHLEQTGEITRKPTNRWQTISIVNWANYQNYELPTNNQLTSNQQSTNNQLTTNEQRNKVTRKQSNIFVPPKIEEIIAYCKERENDVNPIKFFDFYNSKGWMVGKNKMVDWKASVRTWEQKDGRKKKAADYPEHAVPELPTLDLDKEY